MSERLLLSDKALRVLLSVELGSLRRYAMSLTGSLDDADDVVQATVVRALDRGVPADGPKPWLVRVCKNIWIDELRKRKVRRHDEYLDDSTTQLEVDERISIEAQVDSSRQFQAIGAALQLLSDEHRVVLSMVVVEGLGYAEVAALLDLPIGTVMSRLARARVNLKRHLNGE